MSPQNHSPNPPNDFESVELEELDKGVQQKEKAPRRIIHFSSGETMEEYSTDEEEDGEDKEQERKDLLSSPVDAVRVRTSERTVDLITETVSSLFVLKWLLHLIRAAVKDDLGALLLVPYVESGYVHHLRFV